MKIFTMLILTLTTLIAQISNADQLGYLNIDDHVFLCSPQVEAFTVLDANNNFKHVTAQRLLTITSKQLRQAKKTRDLRAVRRLQIKSRACRFAISGCSNNFYGGPDEDIILDKLEMNLTAQFYNTNNPSVIVAEKSTSDILLDYINMPENSIGLGIEGDDLGVTWSGTFNIPESTTKELHIETAFSDVLVTIDGIVVHNGVTHSGLRKPINLTAGQHSIKVKYVSNYFSANLMVRILNPREILYVEQVENLVNENTNGGEHFFYASTYKSSEPDGSVIIDIKPTVRPVVLFLHSNEPVIWKINEAYYNQLKVVLVSSYRKGSYVERMPSTAKLAYVRDDRFAISSPYPRCKENNPFGIYCDPEPKDIYKFLSTVEAISAGNRIQSYDNRSEASRISLPKHTLSDQQYDDLISNLQDLIKVVENSSPF